MQLLGFTFFLAAFLLSMAIVIQMVFANRARILEALMGELPEPEASPPAQIYHFPVRQPLKIEWREAA